MEEIDLKELFNYFKKKIFVILFIILFICIAGCLYGLFVQVPKYKSYTTIVLGGNELSGSITQSDVTLNNNLVDTYTEIVKSRRVLNQVIKKLKLDISYSELCEYIDVTSVNDTEIIKITVSHENPKTARLIADTTASYFADEITNLYNMNNVNILDVAEVSDTPYNVNIVKQIIIYFCVGVVVSFGYVFILFYFDRTIKSIEQIEQYTKLPILGSVEYLSKRRNK